MKLIQVDFSNFRSIKDDSLDISNNCTILVGKNEAGKSNILKGIAGGLSSKAFALSSSDKRKRTYEEKDSECYIDFIFQLDQDDISKFCEYIDTKIAGDFVLINGKPITNHDLIKKYCDKAISRYNVQENKHSAMYYVVENATLAFPLIKLTADYEDKKNGTIIKEELDLVGGEKVEIKNILNIFSSYITDYIANNIPQVFYWKNDDKHLLPSKVGISTFVANPLGIEPLKNIFNLAGYNNIAQDIASAKAADGDLTNLLDNISTKATKTFQEKWPDLKNVSIVLRENGDSITIKIKETVNYNMADRSDGFKHFVSILLSLSSKIELKQILNAIILIDEPDTHLYPTAAKYLRDELIKLSDNNTIIYSTHSPFMIDNNNISRHVIVSKENDISSLTPVTEDTKSYSNDSVLLNAIGTSLFEFIKAKNIIFEGWTDFNFFNKALETKQQNHKKIKTFFKDNDIGLTFAHGVSSISNITPILQLSQKNIFIFSDSDVSAKNAKDKYNRENGYQSTHWYTFNDLDNNAVETVEDFIKNDSIFVEVLRDMGKGDIDISQRGDKKIISFLSSGKLTKEEKQKFKELVSKKISYTDIKEEYYTLLQKLIEKIGS